MPPAAVRDPRADFTARNVLFWGRNNTTASKLFRRLLQPPQLGSAVVRSHLFDSPPAAPLRLGGSVRPRKPRPRLPAPQPDPPEPPGPAGQPAGADEAERQRANPPRAEGAGVEGGQRLRSGQSPARRGACAHPPAVCGVFRVNPVSEARCPPTCASLSAAVQKPWEAGGPRLGSPGGRRAKPGLPLQGIRFKRIWERRWRVRKAPLRQSPSPPSRISTRPLNALPLADSCGIQPVLVWKRLRPALRASRSAAAEDGAQLGPQRTAAGWERGSASKMLLRTDTAREAQIPSPTPGKHGSPLPSPISVLTPGDFRKGESGAVPLPSAAGAVAKDKRAAEVWAPLPPPCYRALSLHVYRGST